MQVMVGGVKNIWKIILKRIELRRNKMHPNNVETELELSKQKTKQLEGFQFLKQDKHYGELLIKLFEKFNPCDVKYTSEYRVYVTFNHLLNFQATDNAFQKFATATGLIPTAWWQDGDRTTISFDKLFFPKNTAFVGDPYCAGCEGECTCHGG